jgi:hypothetical protein
VDSANGKFSDVAARDRVLPKPSTYVPEPLEVRRIEGTNGAEVRHDCGEQVVTGTGRNVVTKRVGEFRGAIAPPPPLRYCFYLVSSIDVVRTSFPSSASQTMR